MALRFWHATTNKNRTLYVFGEGDQPKVAPSTYPSCIALGLELGYGFPPSELDLQGQYESILGYYRGWCLAEGEAILGLAEVPDPRIPVPPDDGGGTGGGGTGGGGTGGGTAGSPIAGVKMPIPNGSSKGNNSGRQNAKPPANTPLDGKVLYEPEKKVLSYSDIGADFQAYLGQYITFRETIRLTLVNGLPRTVYATLDRVIPTALVGYYQWLNEYEPNKFDVLEESKIIANIENQNNITAVITKTFVDGTVAALGDDVGAVAGQIYNCNADLQPDLVQNTYLNPLNALPFATASAAFQGDLEVIATIEAASIAPAVPGYKFPSRNPLFQSLTRIPVVANDTNVYTLQLQQNGIFLLPGWQISAITHDVEVIGVSTLDKAPEQLVQPFFCIYKNP